MRKPWKKIPILGRKAWRDIADGTVGLIKRYTASGRGVDGEFPAYSQKYAERKSSGKFRGQSSTSASPDLMLTGSMMRDLKTVGAADTYAVIAWPSQGQKVQWNADMGRAISTEDDAVAKPVAKYILREFDKAIKRNIKGARVRKTFHFGRR